MKRLKPKSHTINRVLLYSAIAIIFSSCVPEPNKLLTEVNLGFNSASFQKVTAFQHAGNTDSLLILLDSKDPTVRYLAARAFASLQDMQALEKLSNLLDDPSVKVRGVAAYAIGQLGSPNSEAALVRGFRQRDTMSVDNSANGEILRALGKVAGAPIARYISSAEGYKDQDTLLTEGQSKALYHFGLRGTHSFDITQHMVNKVRNYNLSPVTRLYAAHYLSRVKDLDIEKVKFQIAEALVDEQDVNVKMALASGLRHTNDSEIYTILLNQLSLEQDYRVVCNIIRTLGSYDYDRSVPIILELLRSGNIHIARTAAEYFFNYGSPKDAHKFRNVAKDSIPLTVKTDLYQAVFNQLPHYYAKTKNATRWQIQLALENETDVYGIIGYLKALGYDPESYPYIIEYAEKAENPIVKTAAMEALGSILAHKDFDMIYQSVSRSNRRKILTYIQENLEGSDEGIIGAAAKIIGDPESGLKELIDSTDFLLAAKQRLKLPGQIESVHAIERALGHLRGVTRPVLTKLDNFKPLDWTILSEVTDKSKAIVKTTKGMFSIQFNTNEAPESVQNFIKLVNDNYYDGKVFHRVVPNFVIQTGSPRGDNYGGADYAIHSELSTDSYDDEGYVGMASAGLHTESTQWFVTHSPTPHLDGKYTIFGKVISGMDVVHAIQVGDAITDVIITHQ